MTYNVFGGTLSITQSISSPDEFLVMKCDVGCNLIHYSMNNGLNDVFVNCVTRVIMTSCLEQTTVQ